jgi:hypothetical protein
MKKYLKALVIATFAMLFVAKTYSQSASHPEQPKKTVEQRTANMVDEMTKAATLTQDEVSKITPFVTEFQKQRDVDMEANKGDKEKLSAARKARIDKLSSEVKGVVTADQYTQLQDYLKNKENNRGNGNNNKPATTK